MINSRKIGLQTRLRDVAKTTPWGLVFFNSKILKVILEITSMIKLLTSSVQILNEKMLGNVFEKVKCLALLFFTHWNKEGNMMGP